MRRFRVLFRYFVLWMRLSCAPVVGGRCQLPIIALSFKFTISECECAAFRYWLAKIPRWCSHFSIRFWAPAPDYGYIEPHAFILKIMVGDGFVIFYITSHKKKKRLDCFVDLSSHSPFNINQNSWLISRLKYETTFTARHTWVRMSSALSILC